MIDTIPVYAFQVRLWTNSIPVRILSHEYPDANTNVKTMLLGRAYIRARNWFIARDPQGKPCMNTPQGWKRLVCSRDHLAPKNPTPNYDDPDAWREYVRLVALGDLIPPDVLAKYYP